MVGFRGKLFEKITTGNLSKGPDLQETMPLSNLQKFLCHGMKSDRNGNDKMSGHDDNKTPRFNDITRV